MSFDMMFFAKAGEQLPISMRDYEQYVFSVCDRRLAWLPISMRDYELRICPMAMAKNRLPISMRDYE